MRLPANCRDNAAALLAGLCNPRWSTAGPGGGVAGRLNAPELTAATLGCWRQCWRVQHVAERDLGFDLGIDDMAEVDRLHESGELEEFFATRRRAYQDRYRAEGVARGIEQGLAERELFGAGTAGRLAGLLAGVGDAAACAGGGLDPTALQARSCARFGNGSPRGS